MHLTDDDLDTRLFGQLVKHDTQTAAATKPAGNTAPAQPLPYNLFKKAERGELWHESASSKRAQSVGSQGASKAVNTSPRQGRRRALPLRQEGLERGQVAIPGVEIGGQVPEKGILSQSLRVGGHGMGGNDDDITPSTDEPMAKHPKISVTAQTEPKTGAVVE